MIQKTVDLLITKSFESFLLGIEIYNKPTIKYRVEGFSFFICNAWELMLKAHLINIGGLDSIKFPKKPDRTISLSACIKKVFTNNKDPLRNNLEKIVELRNASTHYVTEEFETIYIPLFQACIYNFDDCMNRFHKKSINDVISYNFLQLSVNNTTLDIEGLQGKYSSDIIDQILKAKRSVEEADSKYGSHDKFAININHNFHITKNKGMADITVAIDNDSDSKVAIVKELKDPSTTHPYSNKNVIERVKSQLKKKSIPFKHQGRDGRVNVDFNKYHFQIFIKFYRMKEDLKYSYKHKIGSTESYSYSSSCINFIADEIRKNENVTNYLEEQIKKR